MRPVLLAVVLVLSRRASADEPDVFYTPSMVRGSFLARGPGARPAGMGEAFTAVADDASAVSWNPGGLAQARTVSALLMYDSVAAGVNLGYLAAVFPADASAGGVALTYLDYGSYAVRDGEGAGKGWDSVSDMAVSAGWSFRNPPWMGGNGWTGVGVEYAHEGVGGSWGAVNLGSVIRVTPRARVGWAVLHAGPKVKGYSTPSVLKLGWSLGEAGSYRVALDAGYGPADRQSFLAGGCEVFPYPFTVLRLGYKRLLQDQGMGGLTGLTVGLGAGISGWGLSYAYQPFEDLAACHRVALSWSRRADIE
jgi:hypothetical protein